MNQKTLELNTGAKMPIIGLGTFLSEPGKIVSSINTAFKVGYRHVDCALCYNNEDEVGDGIREGLKANGLKREDVFITSKLWNTYHRPELVAKGFEQSLKDLKLEYLDLYLMHWPIAQKPGSEELCQDVEDIPLIDTWREMEKLYKSGKAKAIGVSNFNVDMLKDLLEKCEIKPAVNQIENNPHLPQYKLVKYCQDNGIQVTAYCPLGRAENPRLLEDVTVNEVAKKNNISPAQVVLSWNVQRNVIVIPKSVTPSRIEENFNVVELSKEDFDKISAITIRQRGVDSEMLHKLKVFTDFGDF